MSSEFDLLLANLQKKLKKDTFEQGELFDDGSEEKDLFGSSDEYDEAYEIISAERESSHKLQQDIQRLEQEADEHNLRIGTFNKLFWLLVGWLVVTILVVIVSGIGFPTDESPLVFYLSDNVLMMLLGTTTFNVVGIFAIAANWLFPKK